MKSIFYSEKDAKFLCEILFAIKNNDVDWLAQNIHWIRRSKAWQHFALERTSGAELYD